MKEINQKLETIDKLEDNEKLNQARALEVYDKFFNTWYNLEQDCFLKEINFFSY